MKSHDLPNRRTVIRSLVGGSLLLPGILSELLADERPATADADPLAPKPPHFTPRAKRVIFLNMSGGVSHVDSFDYKPKLIADHNKSYQVPQRMLEAFAPNNRVVEKYFKRPQWEFKQRGQSGLWISDLFPHVAECADDLCLIRSMRNDHPDHFQATLGIHTGSVTFRPAQHRGLGQPRPGHGQPQPAVVHRAGPAACPMRAGRSGRRTFCRAAIKARTWPRAPSRCRTSSGGNRRRTCRSWSSAWPRRSTAGTWPSGPATPTWPPASAASRRRSACRPRPPRRSTCRRKPTRRSGSMACRAAARAASPGNVSWPGGWQSAASASSS